MNSSASGQVRQVRQLRRSSAGSGFSLPFFRRLRAQGEERFRQHGRWISRHQIRTLLLCSLVITSLFYPAVGIYFWASKGGPGVAKGDAKSVWRSLSTPFMDSFASSGRKHVNSLSDLRMIWDDARDLRALDARDTEALSGGEADQSFLTASKVPESASFSKPRCRSLRVEHVFVTTDDVMSGHGHRFGVLDNRILNSALQLQNLISAEANNEQDDENSSSTRCVLARASFPGRKRSSSNQLPVDTCLVLSPLDFWNLDADAISADKDPARTIAQSMRNHTSFGVPLSVPTTLAGRWHLFKRLPRAEYLAFTFFLQDPENLACLSPRQKSSMASAISSAHDSVSPSHEAWLAMLQNLTGRHVKVLPSQQNISHELNLQFIPHRYTSSNTASQLLLFSAYALAVMYISRNLANMRKVHSRFGLAFTGTAQLLISMIMSVSICALLGIRLSFVPWELLPFVIVVVGSESMFTLSKAIIDTPISLPVSSRIAQGLSKVGVSTTLTTLADIVLLSVIAFCIGVKAVREFCIFAIFSLMMDWFLQMTLFVTVLSIDMQRLELADLLTQGTRQHRKTDSEDTTKSSGERSQTAAQPNIKAGNTLTTILRALWGARTARTASLTLILVYMSGLYLYYGTGYPRNQHDPFVLAEDWNKPSLQSTDSASFDPFAHLDQSHLPLPWWTSSPSADLWNSLNPLGARELKITVEPWTILSLKSLNSAKAPPTTTSFAGWALFRPRIRAVIWFAKLVILPISGTTALLWMLLLYLLKDTELLDAQRDKSEAGPLGEDENPRSSFDSSPLSKVLVLANAHKSDIEFLSQDNGFVASFDTTGILQLWRKSGHVQAIEALGPAVKVSEVGGRQMTVSHSGAVTSLALNSKDGWTALGFASGAVCFVKTDGPQVVWEALPVPTAASVVYLRLQRSNPTSAADAKILISCHRDGCIFAWHVPQKGVSMCTEGNGSRTATSSAHWRFFPVDFYGGNVNDERFTHGSLIGCASSDAHFEIRSVKGQDAAVKTIFRLPEEQRGHVRSALLCNAVSTSTTAEQQAEGKLLLLGYTDGTVRHFELETGQIVSTLHLDDGPISDIKATEGEDESSLVFVIQSTSKVSLVIVASGNIVTEVSGSTGVNASNSGSPIRVRTPNGSRTNAANFWAGNSTPPSPSSELANPLSYPMSSHGSASRLRRTSAYMRDRSSSTATISETVYPSGDGALQQGSSALSAPTIRIDERQMRLLGWIHCQRGGCYVGERGACLVGVSRSKRSAPNYSIDPRSESNSAISSRWEYWTLNLREELVMGRGGELMASRHSLALNSPQLGSDAKLQGSMARPQIRFANGYGMAGSLAFTRLHPLLGASLQEGRKVSLLFGFGGSIGVVQHRSDPN